MNFFGVLVETGFTLSRALELGAGRFNPWWGRGWLQGLSSEDSEELVWWEETPMHGRFEEFGVFGGVGKRGGGSDLSDVGASDKNLINSGELGVTLCVVQRY